MIAAANARFRDALEAIGPAPPGVRLVWYRDSAECLRLVPDAEILWLTAWKTDEIERVVAAGHRLRWVHAHLAGVDAYPLQMFRDRRLLLSYTYGIQSIPIAEYALMVMLAAAKGFTELVEAQQRHAWLSEPPKKAELFGSRALLIGYGSIGQAIGERLRPFGVEIVGVRREPRGEGNVIGPDDWRPRLAEFDWIVLSTPLTVATQHLIGAAELDAMKPEAWLLNLARGSLIDHQALRASLLRGHPGGVWLDVTDPEPLPPSDPLWSMHKVILTPHSSWASEHYGERAARLFRENLLRYLKSEDPVKLVDLDAGY